VSISNNAIIAAKSTNSSVAWLFLLEISHPTLTTPIYLVNDTADFISNGQTYLKFPFSITLGEDIDTHLPVVTLTIDNVSRLLVETLRGSLIAPTMVLKLVLSNYPDNVEVELTGLALRNVTLTAQTVSGNLVNESLLETRHPADSISLSGGYHGLFRA